MQALFGQRARRFGRGMEIPSGPLAFTSRHDPLPLSELEQSVLIAAGTGVSGWNFGVPFGPAQPSEHGQFTQRYTGRTAPTAAGIGTPVLFWTDDEGTYLTNTRDTPPAKVRELERIDDDAERILAVCREHTVRLSEERLDLPPEPGHMMEPNFWMANREGSTLFMPVGDVSEQLLGILAIFLANGYVINDDRAGGHYVELPARVPETALAADRRASIRPGSPPPPRARCSGSHGRSCPDRTSP